MGFSRREHWSGLPCPPPGDLPNPGIEPESSGPLALQADSLPLSHRGSPEDSGKSQESHDSDLGVLSPDTHAPNSHEALPPPGAQQVSPDLWVAPPGGPSLWIEKGERLGSVAVYF